MFAHCQSVVSAQTGLPASPPDGTAPPRFLVKVGHRSDANFTATGFCTISKAGQDCGWHLTASPQVMLVQGKKCNLRGSTLAIISESKQRMMN